MGDLDIETQGGVLHFDLGAWVIGKLRPYLHIVTGFLIVLIGVTYGLLFAPFTQSFVSESWVFFLLVILTTSVTILFFIVGAFILKKINLSARGLMKILLALDLVVLFAVLVLIPIIFTLFPSQILYPSGCKGLASSTGCSSYQNFVTGFILLQLFILILPAWYVKRWLWKSANNLLHM